MTPEAPIPTPEKIAKGLIEQALTARQQELEQEFIFRSRIFADSSLLPPRFRLRKPSDTRMEDIVDDLLKVNDKSAVLYESGMNNYEGNRYAQWVTPSRRYQGLFTLSETATRRRIRIAERSTILVSDTNLLESRNWSTFFQNVIQKQTILQ